MGGYLPVRTRLWVSFTAVHKAGMLVYSQNSEGREAGGFSYTEFEASMNYMRPYLKRKERS